VTSTRKEISPYESSFAAWIAALREVTGETKTQIATRAGMHLNTYSPIERGLEHVNLEQLDRIVTALREAGAPVTDVADLADLRAGRAVLLRSARGARITRVEDDGETRAPGLDSAPTA